MICMAYVLFIGKLGLYWLKSLLGLRLIEGQPPPQLTSAIFQESSISLRRLIEDN